MNKQMERENALEGASNPKSITLATPLLLTLTPVSTFWTSFALVKAISLGRTGKDVMFAYASLGPVGQ